MTGYSFVYSLVGPEGGHRCPPEDIADADGTDRPGPTATSYARAVQRLTPRSTAHPAGTTAHH